jgi:hypothetical protein
VLDYLGPRLGADDKVFSFPAAELVNYALGTVGPDPWGYFFPGSPAHAAERRGLAAPETGARTLSAYVAAAVPLPGLRDDLVAARADPDADVRRAAGWALAHLGS